MSKERARRREVRERDAAAQAAAREVARVRAARRQALLAPLRRTRLALTTGRQSGVLAERRRTRVRLIVTALVLAQVLVWLFRPDWPARLAALVIALLAFPVIAAFTL